MCEDGKIEDGYSLFVRRKEEIFGRDVLDEVSTCSREFCGRFIFPSVDSALLSIWSLKRGVIQGEL